MTDPRASILSAGIIGLSCLPFAVKAQNLASGTGFDIPYVRIISSLLICILIVIAASALLRRFRDHGGSGGSRFDFLSKLSVLTNSNLYQKLGRSPDSLKVLESQKITVAADLCRIKIDDDVLVLVITQSAILMLDRKKWLSNQDDARATQDLANL